MANPTYHPVSSPQEVGKRDSVFSPLL